LLNNLDLGLIITIYNTLLQLLKHPSQVLNRTSQLQQCTIFDILQLLHMFTVMLILGRLLQLVRQIMKQNLERDNPMPCMLFSAKRADVPCLLASDAHRIELFALVGFDSTGQVF
jgi:hypothetical protein